MRGPDPRCLGEGVASPWGGETATIGGDDPPPQLPPGEPEPYADKPSVLTDIRQLMAGTSEQGRGL